MIRLPNEANHDMGPTSKSHHKPPSTTGSPPATTKFAAVAGARPRAHNARACGAAKAYADFFGVKHVQVRSPAYKHGTNYFHPVVSEHGRSWQPWFRQAGITGRFGVTRR